MKKLSKGDKVFLISILSVLLLAIGTLIALSLLDYEDPIDQAPEVVPLGDYDYSKRSFIASDKPTIYKGEIYWIDPYYWLKRILISDLSYDLRDPQNAPQYAGDMKFPQTSAICPDETHNHGTGEKPNGECPDYKVGSFLIDAYESAGESPIIYRTDSGGLAVDNEVIEASGRIVRYDTGNMKAKTVVTSVDMIDGVMTYDQWVFYTTINAEGVYYLNVIPKKGGDVTTLELGKHGWTLIYANESHVSYQDSANNVYRATIDLQNPEFIFYAETISARDSDHNGIFIYNDYLYFESDYERVPYVGKGTSGINFAKHTIHRVPLDNLYGESEVVAENVLDYCVFGVGNNVLYYQPCIMAERVDERYSYMWTGGQLLGVNLDTLEPAEIVNDVGLNINGELSYAVGNALIVHAFPTDGRYHRDANDGWDMVSLLLDTTTGALYPFDVNMFFFN